MNIIRDYAPSASPPPERITGTIWSDAVAEGQPPSRLRVLRVHLSPGARTCWHQHPFGQILYITAGQGLVQDAGSPVRSIRTGDTVVSDPGVWHWHGAAPDHVMTHLAIHETDEAGTDAVWGDHVTDTEYHAPRG
jgi:quercetin dioxygenase-like cupin family protein